MNDTFAEILKYLLSNYLRNAPSFEELSALLLQLGKVKAEIEKLQILAQEETANKRFYLCQHIANQTDTATRIYGPDELYKLPTSCFSLLHDLVEKGIMTPEERETALLQTMLQEQPSFELEEFKHIICTVFNEKFTVMDQSWIKYWPFTAKELENVTLH